MSLLNIGGSSTGSAAAAAGSSSNWGGAAIAGGSGLVGGLIQAFGARKQQKRQNAFAEKMYNKQRADALSDWQMQNAYNTPEMQMQRLQDAGLNPNLVYGNGADAMSKDGVRSSDAQVPQQQNTMEGVGSGIASAGQALSFGYVDLQAKTAQVDNMKAQNKQLEEQVRAQSMENIVKEFTYLSEIEAKNTTNNVVVQNAAKRAKQELYNLSAQGDVLDFQAQDYNQSALLKGTQYSTEQVRRKNMIDDNTRAWIMSAQNVQESKSRIVSMLYANAKSDSERKMIEESTKSKEFQNWFDSKDKKFLEDLGTDSKLGTNSLKWLLQGLRMFMKSKN